MKNDDIRKALETLELPVHKDEAFSIENYNYITFTESAFRKRDCKFYQDIQVIWVSEQKTNNDYFELDIVKCLEDIGLTFNSGEYGFLQKAKTEDYVNMVTLIFSRPIRKNG